MIEMTTPYYDRTTLANKYEMKRTLFLGKLTGPRQDSYNFSPAGMRLNILYNGQKIAGGEAAKNMLNRQLQGWQPVLGSEVDNPALKEIDEHIAQAGTYLEKMLRIAEAAKDPTLSDRERIGLQIDLGYLQHEMDYSNHAMGGEGSAKIAGEPTLNRAGVNSLRDLRGQYHESNTFKMLERARSRIISGHEWDVAELRNTILEDPGISPGYEWLSALQGGLELETESGSAELSYREVRALYETEDAWIEYLMQQRPEWNNSNVFFEAPAGDPWGMIGAVGMRADPDHPGLKALGYVWTVTDDKSVPTVGEILKGDGRSVMDAEAAAVTAAELRRDLKGLEKKREELLKLAAEYMEVKDLPDDSLTKEDVQDRILQFMGRTMTAFFNTLFRESFQFTFGGKFNAFGRTKEEQQAALDAMWQQNLPLELTFEDMSPWDGPEVLSKEEELPGKRRSEGDGGQSG